MLVLSRGLNDKVVFPTLGITVDIFRIEGNKVRLGIEAPREIPVFRHEIVERMQLAGEETTPTTPAASDLSHSIRNRLNTASLGLHVLHRKLEAGKTEDAEADIFSVFNELKAIEDEIQGRGPAEASQVQSECHRTLVVEDDANERELLSGYLEMSGFHVDTAMDGLQAMVKLTRDERPDVVLLDMRMPKFDGKKTISAIRNNPDYRDLKVFGVSGEKRSSLDIPLGNRGVDRWFSKPLNPQELVVAIHEELTTDHVSA
ncbi:MAG: response regulator [Planctomycetota bacterium]